MPGEEPSTASFPDSCTAARAVLFDNLIGAGEQRGRHRDAESVRRLEVDYEIELGSGARRLVKSTPTSNPFAAACYLVEPGLEVLQGLDALSNYWVIHASSPLWCDIPSKSVRFVIVDDADRLHPGIDDDGSHELETALPHGI